MLCPKCEAPQSDGSEICGRCGIVFAKYYKYHPPGEDRKPPDAAPAGPTEGAIWRELLAADGARENPLAFGGRLLLYALLLFWSWDLLSASIASNRVGESFLHLINLPFHEAGHVLFRPFGQFLGSLGGTLGQFLMPLICAGVLLLQTRDAFGAAVASWWFGENFLDIAPYVADARAGQLALLGGNTGHSAPYGFHDWQYLLTETGLIRQDQLLASLAFGLGGLVMLAGLLWAGWLLWRQWSCIRG